MLHRSIEMLPALMAAEVPRPVWTFRFMALPSISQ
jgi:hypothetical protein